MARNTKNDYKIKFYDNVVIVRKLFDILVLFLLDNIYRTCSFEKDERKISLH